MFYTMALQSYRCSGAFSKGHRGKYMALHPQLLPEVRGTTALCWEYLVLIPGPSLHTLMALTAGSQCLYLPGQAGTTYPYSDLFLPQGKK